MDNNQPSDAMSGLLSDPFSPLANPQPSPSPEPNFLLPAAPTSATNKPRPSRQTQTFGALPTSVNPRPPFISLSPTPSTPANNNFNPDDFFASPPHQQQISLIQPADRFTPDLKRRLFGPSDPLSSEPNTARKTPTRQHSLGFNTPIPQPSFTNPLSSNPTDEGANSLSISPTFSTASKLFSDVVPTTQALTRLETAPVEIGLNKPIIISQTLPPQPGTPFTPTTQKAKCSCKASKCLKLYCPCFASSAFCGSDCTCKNCTNTLNTSRSVRDARETVLARDPRAFDPKVRNSPAAASRGDIHSKGCNCRKGCAKNYCVCRELKVDCGPRCTCSGPNGCLNGKSDALENYQFKNKTEYIHGDSKSPKLRTELAPKSVTAKAGSNGNGHKRERKRLKMEPKDKAGANPSVDDVADVLSPSFPAFSFSPKDDFNDLEQEFQKALANGEVDNLAKSVGNVEPDVSPFSLHNNRQPMELLHVNDSTPLPLLTPDLGGSAENGIFLTSIVIPGAAGLNSPSLKPNEEIVADQVMTEAVDPCIMVDVPLLESKPEVKGEADIVRGENEVLRTPERRKILGDLESASSPTTDGKDVMPKLWGNLRGTLMGREEEKIKNPILPRILRLKVASGSSFRKMNT